MARREYAAIRVGLKLVSPDSFPLKLASLCVLWVLRLLKVAHREYIVERVGFKNICWNLV